MEVFDLTTTDMPYYDNLLKNPDYYRREKGLIGEIVRISPELYFALCAVMREKKNLKGELSMIVPELVDKYAKEMRAGTKFPIPVLELLRNEQEGRQRVAAAQKIGLKEIPVLLVFPVIDWRDWNIVDVIGKHITEERIREK